MRGTGHNLPIFDNFTYEFQARLFWCNHCLCFTLNGPKFSATKAAVFENLLL